MGTFPLALLRVGDTGQPWVPTSLGSKAIPCLPLWTETLSGEEERGGKPVSQALVLPILHSEAQVSLRINSGEARGLGYMSHIQFKAQYTQTP